MNLPWCENSKASRVDASQHLFLNYWEFFMKKFISVFNFTILVVLILSIPLLDKAKADWNSHELSRIRVSTATGLDSLPSEKATSSGTSINYTINAFGIGYTTSTLTIDDSDVKVKKVVVSWICQ